ncbi:MAG: AGE family epimerase/isomerase [Armatimonadota bacterium]|nr:AGE family epimerase/isomerase [Armatimonadota bacterium]
MKPKPTRREFLAEAGASAAILALAGTGAIGAGPASESGAGAPAGRKVGHGPYLDAARTFLDTLVDKGTDRYGKKHTPVFCLSLDPETYSPPKPPAKVDWDYIRGFEYLYQDYGFYWKSHMHGSGLIYDQGTIRALYALTEATGKPKYRKAADAYLDFFLDNLISPQTGIFGWGEHIFYNVFADILIGGCFRVAGWHEYFYGHEFDRCAPIYDLFWEKSPEKTLAEIDAIYEYKIVDHDTFINNRHSDYFIGKTSDVFTFHKHTALFVHAFALAYSKTQDRKYLDWARKSCDVFWKIRDLKTDLVTYCPQWPDDKSGGIEAFSVRAYMRAYQWHPDPMFLDRALAYMRAYQNHLAQPSGGQPRWAKTAAVAYSLSGDDSFLKTADNIISAIKPEQLHGGEIERSLITSDTEELGDALSAALDLYELTADAKYLAKAREFADDAIGNFLYKGLFVGHMRFNMDNQEGPRVKIYDARGGAGYLALNLIRLQRHANATEAGKFKKTASLDRTCE